MGQRLAVFYDIGDTLASPVITDDQLTGLVAYPFVREVLQESAGPDVVLGLISNTGNETGQRMRDLLEEADLLVFFRDELLLFSSEEGLSKPDPAFFARARERADVPASRCLFVGENLAERDAAASLGFLVSPHPLHALHLIREVT